MVFWEGRAVAVLDTFYGFYTPGTRAIKVVGGIADDVVSGLQKLGNCFERPNTYGAGTGVTYNSEHLKVVWERLVLASGANILLHAWIQEAKVSERRIRAVTIATKQGLRGVEADFFVDATGDADVCYFPVLRANWPVSTSPLRC